MPSIWEYANQVAAGDTGCWQAATRRAAILLAPTHPVITVTGRLPVHQVLVQTTSLVIYGRTYGSPANGRPGDSAAHDRLSGSATAGRPFGSPAHGHVVSGPELAAWVTGHALPAPDSAPGNLAAAVRHLLDSVAVMLRTAGHRVPEPGGRSLRRHSTDPVIQQWHDLTDVDDAFPGPLLCLGVAAMSDTFGPAIV